MISEDKLFNILYMSVASIWRFFSLTVADLALERSSLNDEKWSLRTIVNALSWSLFWFFLSDINYPDYWTISKLRLMLSWCFSIPFEGCTLIFLPGCVFLRGDCWEGNLQMSICDL